MSDYKLLGHDYTTPDLIAKVTGRAKYAEDYRADGMSFCKLLLSPMPHCRVRRIDASAALAMPGVKGMLTADDLPPRKAAGGEAGASLAPEVALTNEPVYKGEPILAVAAVDELTAAEAIEKITLDLEPLPFVVDPLESLRPNGPSARREGNAFVEGKLKTVKWTAQDFAGAPGGQMPTGEAGVQWSYGDLSAGFQQAALVLEETFHTQTTSHQPLETRTAMAYWQNGKLYLHCSTQSVMRTVETVAQWVGLKPEQVVVISEYTGGGFGSKIPGTTTVAVPALLAKKIGGPVMMRISREEEHYIGRHRPSLMARVKIGFRADGRVTAVDMFILQDAGPYEDQFDLEAAPMMCSLAYQPPAMRFRGLSVLTNTPPPTSQRAPGGAQMNAIMEPLLAQAAHRLKIDAVALHRINAPSGKALLGGPNKEGKRSHVTSAFVQQAIDRGADLFQWNDRKARSGTRNGTKARGIGISVSPFIGGYSIGYDSVMTIRPDGKLYVQSGIGNLGTHSVIDTARVAAEVLDAPWETVEVVWGDTSKNLPYTCTSDGSQTIHAMSRSNHAGAMDAKQKLLEIAARDLGGRPDDYRVGGGRVYQRANPARHLTFAQAAQRAIALGGKYDGHELPSNIHATTRAAAAALAGVGLMGVAKDEYPHDGETHSYVVGFAEVEVDVETGVVTLVDYAAVADVGIVVNPRSLGGQVLGGGCLGIGHALTQRSVYDHHYGVPLAMRFHHSKPLTILDVPATMRHAALDLPDPETPVGARGVGEPPVGAGLGSVLSAIADAVGDDVFRRIPVTPDVVLTSLDAGRRLHDVLSAYI
ncbi:MAG TPA: xanthine dehydrogenase family protein molybdopterin-binding subunit [Vicinamibacterales bacterium]|nr:xanthine dehydrogenase family protein molybdopterin-binding subunit [Vicinamibacterales bacterium]